MTDPAILSRSFTRNLRETIAMVAEKFPNDNQVLTACHQIRTLLNTNGSMVVRRFHKEVTPYVAELRKRDLSFFLALQEDALGDLDLARRISAFDDTEKNLLWDRFNLLYDLSAKIQG